MKTGVYRYSIMKWDAQGVRFFESFRMKVEILDETPARYRVRYMEPHANRDPVNSVHLVRRDKVFIKDPEVKPAQDIELRLPYKDD
jgi:hypothetical protein